MWYNCCIIIIITNYLLLLHNFLFVRTQPGTDNFLSQQMVKKTEQNSALSIYQHSHNLLWSTYQAIPGLPRHWIWFDCRQKLCLKIRQERKETLLICVTFSENCTTTSEKHFSRL